MKQVKLKIYSYVGAIFLIVGFISLRFTFHEGVFLFPVTLMAIGFILSIIAMAKRVGK